MKKILNWFNWAWVESHAQNYIPFELKEVLKITLILLYIMILSSFIVAIFYSMVFSPLMTLVILFIGSLSLPVVSNMLNVPLKDEDEDDSEYY